MLSEMCVCVVVVGALILASPHGSAMVTKREGLQLPEDAQQPPRDSEGSLPNFSLPPLPTFPSFSPPPPKSTAPPKEQPPEGIPRTFCDGFGAECIAPPDGKCPTGYRYDSRGKKCRKLSP
uniref:U13-Liphistoxin-Lth1a_1 n=1 Tax=Liphistius thaleban TaxID=1905330 RepID=A0A4V2H934_9ARAC